MTGERRDDVEREACPGCGSLIPRGLVTVHPCDWFQWLDHQLELRRGGHERREGELAAAHDAAPGPIA
ncbi:MAG: hypothetical protein RMM28_06840, partial [Thermoleophilia bacterium]|nr:hypothetical protein [Gaiellaceae bacterium]MDW8338835.1 hypothetical protein [Thermoleophilia bacterium]